MELREKIHSITSLLARRVVAEVSKKGFSGETIVRFNGESDKELLALIDPEQKCPDCNGEGEIFHRGEADTLKAWSKCKVCKGTGKVSRDERIRKEERTDIGEGICVLVGNLMLEDEEAGKLLGEQLKPIFGRCKTGSWQALQEAR